MTAKLLGAAVLVACGAAIGWSRVAEQRRALALLCDIAAALGVIAEEVSAFSAPLPAVFSRLAENGPESTRDFFAAVTDEMDRDSLAGVWTKEIGGLPVDVSERRELESLALCLGRSEGGSQAREIGRVRDMLLMSAAERRQKINLQNRCSMGVCISAAAMLAVMLM